MKANVTITVRWAQSPKQASGLEGNPNGRTRYFWQWITDTKKKKTVTCEMLGRSWGLLQRADES